MVKLWENAGERRSPSVFGGGTPFDPLACTTAVGGRGERGVPPRPLHHQLKSKYGQFFARKPQVLLHSSDSSFGLEEPVRPSAAVMGTSCKKSS